MIDPTTARKELEAARGTSTTNGPRVWTAPGLALRARLTQFAIENGLESEGQAMIVVAARYFRLADAERWAGWTAESEDGKP
jgi:hypothetical protein